MSTTSRKEEHIKKTLLKESQYKKTTGLEDVEFIYSAMPELDYNKIDITTKFLDKDLSMPLMVTGMTGGYNGAKIINKELARNAEKYKIAFGLGSGRAMIENKDLLETYYVRDVAPTIPIIANIGAYQIKKYSIEDILYLKDSIEADAIAIHLNPLQEIIQPEGDVDFSNVYERIAEIAKHTTVIVKEVGTGINPIIVDKLLEIGVKYIDVSGSGGTSWSKVEYLRGGYPKGFEEFGLRTADVVYLSRGKNIIGSGGIRSGIDAMKVIALGAKIAGAAQPFLKAVVEKKVDSMLKEWKEQMKTVLFLTGSKNLEEFRRKEPIIIIKDTKQRIEELEKVFRRWKEL